MAYEGYMVILFGIVIVVQQFIIYLMYVRIRQLLSEVDSIEGKIKITDTELENLIMRVEEFKRGTIWPEKASQSSLGSRNSPEPKDKKSEDT
jgi:cell division protein FtsL